MYIFGQHGYGKTDKIEKGLETGDLGGVIFSPKNEKPDNLTSYIRQIAEQFEDLNPTLMVDPQFYLATQQDVKDGFLPEYGYYQPRLNYSSFVRPRDVQGYVKKVIEFQLPLRVNRIVSPTVCFKDFNDRWSHVSLQMAEESASALLDASDDRPLLVSIVIGERALLDRQSLDEFLDIITVMEVGGFYVILDIDDTQYPGLNDPEVLASFMYLVYVLSVVRGLEVISGYSDLVGLLLHATGIHATGTGWFNTLRQFSMGRFQPSTGGRRAVPRYTSMPLLNSIKVIPELQQIKEADLLGEVLTGTRYDGVLHRSSDIGAIWNDQTSWAHHWQALSISAGSIGQSGTVEQNLRNLLSLVDEASVLYDNLVTNGISFEASTGPRALESWKQAIASFKKRAGL